MDKQFSVDILTHLIAQDQNITLVTNRIAFIFYFFQWEAFSLPELDNFLRILDREEGEYKNQIKDKYALLRQRIQSQLARIAPINT